MTTLRRPPGRYDESRPLPRPVRISAAVTLLLLLIGLAYLTFDRLAGDRVQFATLGYLVVSDTRVDVRFEVRKDLGDTVTCEVRARDRDGAVVGRDLVQIGPSDRDAVLTVQRLDTTGRAATAEVSRCALAEPTAP